jgi:hypothetical protein
VKLQSRRKRQILSGPVIGVVLLSIAVLFIWYRRHEAWASNLEAAAADEFRSLAIEIVDKGMTPREAISYARTRSNFVERVNTSIADRNPNAFQNDELPEAFDIAGWIVLVRDVPRPYELFSKATLCTIEFKEGRAYRWSVMNQKIDSHTQGYSGRREEL